MIIYALWLRQIKRYFRAKSRVVSAIGQPLLFLLALGYGLGSVYSKAHGGNYIHFLVPGIMVQSVLFTAVFFGINVIFDRQFGFLKETLVTPVSRLRIMLGGALGGATTSTVQGLLVFFISLFLGFRPYDWPLFLAVPFILGLLAIALTSFSSAVGSMVNDFQGFQAINQFIIFPLFFLSGALYPLENAPRALQIIGELNPVSYAVDALRAVLINQSRFGLGKDLVVMTVTALAMVAFAAYRFTKIEA